jgi:hypothetical protein
LLAILAEARWQALARKLEFPPLFQLGTRLASYPSTDIEGGLMYDRRFFATRLGQAALASIAAMVMFVMLSTQIAVTAPMAQVAVTQTAELA